MHTENLFEGVSGRQKVDMLIGLIAGLMVPLLACLLAEYFDALQVNRQQAAAGILSGGLLALAAAVLLNRAERLHAAGKVLALALTTAIVITWAMLESASFATLTWWGNPTFKSGIVYGAVGWGIYLKALTALWKFNG